MRIAVVQPGVDLATQDVFVGIVDGLTALGHEVTEYDYGFRLSMAEAGRKEMWEAYHNLYPGIAPPTHHVLRWDAGHALYSACALADIEAVVIITADLWHPDHTILLRRLNIPVGIVHTEGPYADDLMAVNLSLANIVWSNERTSVEPLAEAAARMEMPARVKYLPVGYNRMQHRPDLGPIPGGMEGHEVVFVGTGFQERIDLLEKVDFTGIDFGLYGHWTNLKPAWGFRRRGMDNRARAVRPGGLRGAILKKAAQMGVRGVSPLWQHLHHGVVANKYTADLYRKSEIGLNLGRKSTDYRPERRRLENTGESMGPRIYELAACGTFFISEHRAEIPEMFGDLVPTFTTADELTALLRYWLPRPAERAARAALLPGCVEQHSYRHRAAVIVQDLREVIVERGGALSPTKRAASSGLQPPQRRANPGGSRNDVALAPQKTQEV